MKKLNVFAFSFFMLLVVSARAQSIELDTKPDKVVQVGEVFTVDVKAKDFTKIISCQFAVFWNSGVVEYLGVQNHGLPEVTADNLGETHAQAGRIRFNWVDPDPTFPGFSIDDDNSIFSLRFKAVGSPAMSTMIEIKEDTTDIVPFPIEFVNADETVLETAIESGRVTIDGANATKESVTEEFTLYQNSPNPFITQTNISFDLNQKSNATLSIHDHAGKVVFEKNGEYGRGTHTIQVGRDLFSSAGSYFFTLNTQNATATRQLVVQ